jgi:hypothetical protein
MGTGCFPAVESGRGVTLAPHPLLAPRSKNTVRLYLYTPYGPSWPVKRVKLTVFKQVKADFFHFVIYTCNFTESYVNSESEKTSLKKQEYPHT